MAFPTPPSPQADTALPRGPHSLGDLFLSFALMALQGFGGVLAVVQRELVEKKGWLTPEEFVEDWAVAQILPGPNVINLAIMLGERWFGWRGALVGPAGILILPTCVVLAIAIAYGQLAHHPAVAGALRGMGAVTAGLIAATGFKMFGAMRKHPMGRGFCLAVAVLCFAAVALLRLPMAWVLPFLGAAACALTYRTLARRQKADAA